MIDLERGQLPLVSPKSFAPPVARQPTFCGLVISLAALAAAPAMAATTRHHRGTPPPPHVVPASGDLGLTDFLSFAANGLKPPARDAFSGPQPNKYAGRHFVIRLGVAGPDSDRAATWAYSIPDQTLTATLHFASMEMGSLFGNPGDYRYISGVALMSNYHRDGRAVGRNAFGVRIRYEIGHALILATGRFDDRASVPDDVRVKIVLPPDVARREAAAMTIEISGTIRESPFACGVRADTATIDNPYQITTTTCGVPANIERVVVHGLGDKVLGEWPVVPPPPPPPRVITKPDWVHLPSADDFARFYPDRAQRLEFSGSATISCTVSASGTLYGCEVMSEEPPDMGFGQAAIKMSKFFKMKPQTTDGAAVEGATLLLPLHFSLPKP